MIQRGGKGAQAFIMTLLSRGSVRKHPKTLTTRCFETKGTDNIDTERVKGDKYSLLCDKLH